MTAFLYPYIARQLLRRLAHRPAHLESLDLGCFVTVIR